jgi:hypothetical protein
MNSTVLYFVVCALLISSLCCCKISNSSKNTSQQLIASIERTPCFGKCPAYKIDIFENGDVTYFGNNFVDSIGKFTTLFTEKERREILNLFTEAGFTTLPKILPDNTPIPTDIPSVIYTLNNDGKTYTVRDYDINRTGRLFKIVAFVEKVLETKTLHRRDN